MIRLMINDESYTITNNFRVIGKDATKVKLLKQLTELYTTGLQPQDGEPILILADKLKQLGYEVTKVVPPTYPPDMIF